MLLFYFYYYKLIYLLYLPVNDRVYSSSKHPNVWTQNVCFNSSTSDNLRNVRYVDTICSREIRCENYSENVRRNSYDNDLRGCHK